MTALVDFDLFRDVERREQDDKENLQRICDHYEEVVEFLRDY